MVRLEAEPTLAGIPAHGNPLAGSALASSTVVVVALASLAGGMVAVTAAGTAQPELEHCVEVEVAEEEVVAAVGYLQRVEMGVSGRKRVGGREVGGIEGQRKEYTFM